MMNYFNDKTYTLCWAKNLLSYLKKKVTFSSADKIVMEHVYMQVIITFSQAS